MTRAELLGLGREQNVDGEEAAIGDADIADVCHVSRGSDDGGIFASQVFALQIGGVVAIGAVEHAIAIHGLQKALFSGAHRLVAFHLIEIFAPAQTAAGGNLRHQKRFRAKRLGCALLGVHAQPIDRGAHHDDAGHADDHPQQREETS